MVNPNDFTTDESQKLTVNGKTLAGWRVRAAQCRRCEHFVAMNDRDGRPTLLGCISPDMPWAGKPHQVTHDALNHCDHIKAYREDVGLSEHPESATW